MDGLKRLRTPGLFLSGILNAIGLLLLWFSIDLNSNKSRSETVHLKSKSEYSKQLYAEDEPVRRSTPQLSKKPEGQLHALVWLAFSCWFLSLCSLTPALILALLTRKSSDQATPSDWLQSTFGATNPTRLPPNAYAKIQECLDDLEDSLKNQPVQVGEGFFLRSYRDNLEHLDSQTKLMYNSITNSHDTVQKTVIRIQRLFRQCRESANFAATNRLDWKRNTMLGNLSQVRQSHDRVLDTSKNVAAIHASTLRLLSESIQGEEIFYQKIDRVQEYLDQVQNSAHIGYKAHDRITTIIGESREAVANAAKLVNGLAQRTESFLAVLKLVDDIAEKINFQAINAAVVASRSKNGQHDVVGFATEFRGLAAKFQTQSRNLQDLTHSIHEEIETSLHHLTDADTKAEHAFSSVNQCGELYRNNVSATKYGLSELVLLHKEVAIHMKKLAETRDLGESAAQLMTDMDKHLSGYNEMNKRISEETNQMAAHCDKLSHLLSKQYYELSHCEKMLTDSTNLLSESSQYAAENKQNVVMIRTGLEEISRNEPGSHAKASDEDVWNHKLRSFRQLVRNMEDDQKGVIHETENRASLVPVISVRHG